MAACSRPIQADDADKIDTFGHDTAPYSGKTMWLSNLYDPSVIGFATVFAHAHSTASLRLEDWRGEITAMYAK
jgi:hypothetical protein